MVMPAPPANTGDLTLSPSRLPPNNCRYSQDVNKVWEKIQETAFEVNQGAFQESGVPFSYSVIFTDSEIPWTHRWDAYLLTGGGQIHVFSTINSLVVAMLLTFVVAAILLRTIRNDISQYEAMLADEEGALEDLTGWKLVSGVSRPPAEMRWRATDRLTRGARPPPPAGRVPGPGVRGQPRRLGGDGHAPGRHPGAHHHARGLRAHLPRRAGRPADLVAPRVLHVRHGRTR